MIAFGPVPSRRLGYSLGINNISPKICNYSCIYCQLGKTLNMNCNREKFHKPDKIIESVNKKIKEANEKNLIIDYLTFVSNGEPTLDINIGIEIESLQSIGKKIALITNGSLLWDKDVQKDISEADYVSIKVDTVNKLIWKKINRPHKLLNLDKILSGLIDFSKGFNGDLTTETMLINDINDKDLEKTAEFIEKLNPKKSYLSIPTRPPSEKWAIPTTEYKMNLAYQNFNNRGLKAEFLISYEGNKFGVTGNIEEDLLSITSVHPMREDAVKDLLLKSKVGWELIEQLIKENKIKEIRYQDKKYYLKKLQ